jgi:hypothetical protein
LESELYCGAFELRVLVAEEVLVRAIVVLAEGVPQMAHHEVLKIR